MLAITHEYGQFHLTAHEYSQSPPIAWHKYGTRISLVQSIGPPKQMNTFFGQYLYFCLELALETWAKASMMQCVQVHDIEYTHSLVGFQCQSGLSNQPTLLLTKIWLATVLHQKYWLYKGRVVVSTPVCANMVRSDPVYSQPRQLPCAWHVLACLQYARTSPPIPHVLVVQNLPSKHCANW